MFFTKMKHRQLQSYVYAIKDEQGRVVEGFEDVAQLITNYYQKLLGAQQIDRISLNRTIMGNEHVLLVEQQLSLLAPFFAKDIKDAIWSIPSTKSPDPDGFSSSFYKAGWTNIGHHVVEAV